MQSNAGKAILSDPFSDHFEVGVNGGTLQVARAGPPPEASAAVVLAAHGVTASLMTWRSLARVLGDDVCLLAPDLRGRGHSAELPGPYGIAAHVTDLLGVLDATGVSSAVLVGHSMGAYVLARLAAEHPERARALVALDAGLPLPPVTDLEDTLEAAVANVIMRLSITFPSAARYLEGWRAHPAFADAWDEDIEAYARYDLALNGSVARCVCNPAAVRADTEELVSDPVTRTALERVQCPVYLLRAERGLFNEPDAALITAADLRAFAAAHPSVQIEAVPGVNHYTLVMGAGPGPRRVATAIEAATGTIRRMAG
ncbi:alpha/beta hydrolase [Solirubrobacter ginsenosidimutans]|uniref:Alpha/beta hydrolase n=1 Tax=Solirubrobacter ginsenosidimutans TaxID=490573 RepID=A0A9X3N3U7_9ACTN|nr:alpha/beta hydrolase [Solirubrobacter ginsenosidimutans]MDA0164348.1 alpha/beta hydrolase [Solirubrobacter ginsenosidimutans]